jgi:hypothetical protein
MDSIFQHALIHRNGENNIFAQWLDHSRLSGMICELWIKQGEPDVYPEYCDGDEYNTMPIRIGLEELAAIEKRVNAFNMPLPKTADNQVNTALPDSYHEVAGVIQCKWYDNDLQFIKDARRFISEGFEVWYCEYYVWK